MVTPASRVKWRYNSIIRTFRVGYELGNFFAYRPPLGPRRRRLSRRALR
jgi:hypothetical protein